MDIVDTVDSVNIVDSVEIVDSVDIVDNYNIGTVDLYEMVYHLNVFSILSMLWIMFCL